jgi:hypothetical protein
MVIGYYPIKLLSAAYEAAGRICFGVSTGIMCACAASLLLQLLLQSI